MRNASRKKRRKKGDSVFLYAARWLTAVFAAVFLAWSLAAPESAGKVGLSLHGALTGLLGSAAYLLPPLVFYALAWFFRYGKAQGLLTLSLGGLLTLAGGAMLLGLAGQAAARPDWGGAAGEALAGLGSAAVGRFGAILLGAAVAALGLQVLFDIPWGKLLWRTMRLLLEDYKTWRRGRKELKDILEEAARKRLAEVESAAPRIAPIPEPAKAGAGPAIVWQEPAAAVAAPLELPPAPAEPAPKARAPRKEGSRAAEAAAPKPAAEGAPYAPPPISILQARAPGEPGGRPTDAEIQEAVASLERTLASFQIEARVSGISPGPVITRYEVSPAPGVTVSSIVARSNDLALAMRAKGIRMIAPIPGKAAIGIEIPNQKPAMVRLRDVLESRALAKESAALAFALGLSSDGTPLAADLAAMPHVLVAGATNSGKSVMVHSLIASILFRQAPDRVKFLLIDPKRIELTLYDGIPHLYDPKTPPAEVRVITQAKQAAQALKALVRVMEDRYEKFQVYRVRDIEQFNREAAQRGERPEFYIVVVIDELADLMVVARDEVEDSIQRLTQMARAVGIHMVIATQRPSVDVLTGVIKANLPSRIAMRVASKVDSKVIIDGNGAEALLGKGDTLYLSPGQDPARIQGCFVSTQEISALVDHLKAQAPADYPLLDTMVSSVGEADLSQFGVEPLEFSQALKLVLERRRVSQDLLKSQFGSSARATNLLSLLEVKGFIQKPEGSNRWNIHFDKIEDYIRQHFPQINLDKKGI